MHAAENESNRMPIRGLAIWWHGARPRTWGAGFAPVITGCAIASTVSSLDVWLALLALIVALSLQVGVNYANDYSDGLRGTDQRRLGPVRLVGQGLATPRAVKRAAYLSFFIGAITGLSLSYLSGQLWLIAVGALAIVAAWFYTGGSHPYGYAGFGELVAFIFFGPVAVIGTSLTQSGQFQPSAIWGGVAMGLFAAALLLVNNIRDIETDKQSGKRTIAVALGLRHARLTYVVFLAIAFSCLVPISLELGGGAGLAVVAILPAGQAIRGLVTPKGLPLTSASELVYALGLAFGLTLLA